MFLNSDLGAGCSISYLSVIPALTTWRCGSEGSLAAEYRSSPTLVLRRRDQAPDVLYQMLPSTMLPRHDKTFRPREAALAQAMSGFRYMQPQGNTALA